MWIFLTFNGMFCVVPQNVLSKKIKWWKSKFWKMTSFLLRILKHTHVIPEVNNNMLLNPEFSHKFTSPTSPTFWFRHTDGMQSLTLTSSISPKRMSPFLSARQILLTCVQILLQYCPLGSRRGAFGKFLARHHNSIMHWWNAIKYTFIGN